MKHNRIEVNPKVMLGRPVVKGTRITVEQIIEELDGGMTTVQILKAHPRLSAEDIKAARKFADQYMTESAGG